MDKIHHVAVPVDNIKDGVNWYAERFDINIAYQDDSWALIEFANIYLALVSPNQHPAHFAIENPAAEKYGSLTLHRDGSESIYIKDPSGNTIEILKLPSQ